GRLRQRLRDGQGGQVCPGQSRKRQALHPPAAGEGRVTGQRKGEGDGNPRRLYDSGEDHRESGEVTPRPAARPGRGRIRPISIESGASAPQTPSPAPGAGRGSASPARTASSSPLPICAGGAAASTP